jgi:hypothetical protein
MSDFKGTPGPWKVCEEPPNDYWFAGVTIGAATPSDARRICDVFTGGMTGNSIADIHRANASLIAAAPELLTSLQDVLSVYSEPDYRLCCDGRDCGCMGASVYQQAEHYARAAIAKALGQ